MDTKDDSEFKKNYLNFIQNGYELITVLENNNNDKNSPEFLELWKKLNADIDTAELLDSVLYPKEFGDMMNDVKDYEKLKVLWRNEMVMKIGDYIDDGLIVGVFDFTVWVENNI